MNALPSGRSIGAWPREFGYAKSNEVIQGIFFKENPLSNIIVYCTAVASGI